MQTMRIRGRVISGVKKGAYYVSLDVYKKFFRELLGRDPFPGTLNVEINNGVHITSLLRNYYHPPDKKFSPISYALGRIGDKTVVIIKPKITIHGKNIVEIVADEKLREKFNLKDGDLIEIEINI